MNTTTPTDPTTETSTGAGRRRRGTVLGVGAGLVGGGLVGLLMTVPSLTSAASEDTGDTVVAALQDADTSGDDATGATDGATDERPEPGVHLRELLQPLVDDGTIDAAQADAVTEYLVEHRPEREGRGDHGRRGPKAGFDGEVVAELLGIDTDQLRESLLAGQSIADIAEANGVDVQTVIDALVAEAESHLDLAVENGRLTEDEAAEKLAQITEQITARVNGERPARD